MRGFVVIRDLKVPHPVFYEVNIVVLTDIITILLTLGIFLIHIFIND